MGRFYVQLCCFYIGVNSTVKKGNDTESVNKDTPGSGFRDVAKSPLPANFTI